MKCHEHRAMYESGLMAAGWVCLMLNGGGLTCTRQQPHLNQFLPDRGQTTDICHMNFVTYAWTEQKGALQIKFPLPRVNSVRNLFTARRPSGRHCGLLRHFCKDETK
jgi:hypothetical protein